MNLWHLFSALLSLAATATQLQHFGLFGDVHLTRPEAAPHRAVLLISDHDGWHEAEENLATALARAGALVIGIDLAAYERSLAQIKGKCAFPAGHVEEMAHWVERHENLTDYDVPLLVGRGAGANVAYAIAAQAPSGTFAGLITLGWRFHHHFAKDFCPGDMGAMTVADPTGGFRTVPVARLDVPWLPLLFAGPYDGAIPALSPGVVTGESLSVRLDRWQRQEMPVVAVQSNDIADLPLTEVEPEAPIANRIAIMLTGDGGWAGLDKGVAEELSQRGMRVVGLSSLKFFWRTRTPEEIAAAVARIVSHYSGAVPQARFVLIGYSFGASLTPIVVNRLPEAVRAKIDVQFMISPDSEAVFEIKVGDWFGGVHHEGSIPITPELARSVIPAFCVYGADEEGTICPSLGTQHVTNLSLPGGHHFDGDYGALGRLIVAHLPR